MRSWFPLCVLVHFAVAGVARAQSPDTPAYHIEAAPVRHVQAVLTDTWEIPNIIPRQWAFFVPLPPTLPCQDQVKAEFRLNQSQSTHGATAELSPLHRPILWIKASAPQANYPTSITASVVYKATLYSRKLVPGASSVPIPPLSPSERSLNLRASKTIDWQAVSFQHWLDVNYLHRQPSERDLDYAFRVYQTIRSLYHYNYDAQQDRRASLICQTNHSDCGGLSYLFVAALRAGGVSAHALAGRLAQSTTTPTDYFGCHVKSEFFAEGIGWVPVDMSFGVGSRDKDAQRNFGNDPGDLIVMHSDSDLELEPKPFGPAHFYVMQGMLHWVWGEGKLDGSKDRVDWQVKDLPMETLRQTAASPMPPTFSAKVSR